MRGSDGRSGSLFSYVDLEDRVPRGHPLRSIRQIANGALSDLSGDFRCTMYAWFNGPRSRQRSFLRASLLQKYSISVRSERQLMERLDFDLALFRWFVGWGSMIRSLGSPVFSEQREQASLEGEIAGLSSSLPSWRSRMSSSCCLPITSRSMARLVVLGEHEEPEAPGRGWR